MTDDQLARQITTTVEELRQHVGHLQRLVGQLEWLLAQVPPDQADRYRRVLSSVAILRRRFQWDA